MTDTLIADMCVLEMSGSRLGPTGQPCPSCDDPDGKHRVWDDIARRWHTDDTLDELAAEYAKPSDDWPYGADAICAVMLGQAAWLIAEAKWEAGYVRGILAETTRTLRQPDLDGLEDAQALHLFPWERHDD